MPNGSTVKERLATGESERGVIKSDIKYIKSDVRSIKENHLPHIKAQIEEVDDKVNKISWKVGTIVGFGAMVGSAFLSKLINYLFPVLK